MWFMLFSIIYIVMKCLIILLILAVLLFSLNFVSYSSEYFEDSKSVVICKADWCGHCKKAAPEFQKLVSASPITLRNGNKVNVTMLDADGDKDKLSKYKVRGFPTILVNNGSDMLEYPGERTYDGVIEYLNTM